MSQLVASTDFPILSVGVHGKKLVYLDSAATTQKPQQVIDAITHYYTHSNANVHRGVHLLSDQSTLALEQARATIATFLGAKTQELILVRNTTEALMGIAYGWALHALQPGDVIVTSQLEHHSNFVVWQQVCKMTGATLVVVPVTEAGEIDYAWMESTVSKAKLLTFAYVSNTLGSVLDVARVVAFAKKVGARVALDGAQAVAHIPVSFSALGVDFFAFSGHKLYGPMGSGGLLVAASLLERNEMQPWLFGGGMISEVYESHATFNDDPIERFTAGTPDVASAVGLAAACTYLRTIGMQSVAAHEAALTEYALRILDAVPQLTVIGPRTERVGSVAFLYEGVHAHDVAQVLDSQGVAVRSGHHCTMPLHLARGWAATTRASFGVYSTTQDCDALGEALTKVKAVFGK